MKKETTIKSTGKDEVFAEWYKCKNCGYDDILESAIFCPGCGLKIVKQKDEKKPNKIKHL